MKEGTSLPNSKKIYKQSYTSKLNNLNEIDNCMERHKLLKLTQEET